VGSEKEPAAGKETPRRKPRVTRVVGYLVGNKDNGLTRWCKSDNPDVPWTLYSSWGRPTIFPDAHAARVAIREAAKYWSAFKLVRRTTPTEERSRYYLIRAESCYDANEEF
jgi:hypothetical protein